MDDGNVSVMGVAYIVNRMYSQWQDLPRTNGTDKDIEKFEVKYGDMLFCRSSLVAEGIGKASIAPFWENNNLRSKGGALLPDEVSVYMETGFFGMEGKLNSGDAHLAVDYGKGG